MCVETLVNIFTSIKTFLTRSVELQLFPLFDVFVVLVCERRSSSEKLVTDEQLVYNDVQCQHCDSQVVDYAVKLLPLLILSCHPP